MTMTIFISLEIKSGSDERNFRALPKIADNDNHRVTDAYVFSNKRAVSQEGKNMPLAHLFSDVYLLCIDLKRVPGYK